MYNIINIHLHSYWTGIRRYIHGVWFGLVYRKSAVSNWPLIDTLYMNILIEWTCSIYFPTKISQSPKHPSVIDFLSPLN